MGELKRLFRPELLNRIDDIVVFQKLSGENLTKHRAPAGGRPASAFDCQRYEHQAHRCGLYDKIVAEGTDLTNGARPLRRAIQKAHRGPVVRGASGRREWGEGDTVLCDVADGKFVFSHGTGEIRHRVRRARSVAIPPRRHHTPATPRL